MPEKCLFQIFLDLSNFRDLDFTNNFLLINHKYNCHNKSIIKYDVKILVVEMFKGLQKTISLVITLETQTQLILRNIYFTPIHSASF